MKNFIKILHFIIIVLAYSTPLWLDWRIIFIGVILYWLQILIFKACVLSIAEYKSTEVSFVGTYVNKILAIFGKEIATKHMKLFLNYILPIIILS